MRNCKSTAPITVVTASSENYRQTTCIAVIPSLYNDVDAIAQVATVTRERTDADCSFVLKKVIYSFHVTVCLIVAHPSAIARHCDAKQLRDRTVLRSHNRRR